MIEDPHKVNIKSCVLLFNLGGPNSLREVEKFLFSLFFDKRIITIPTIPRFFLAKFISKLRKRKATEIYKKLGGKSPLGENTLNQAIALQDRLFKDFSKFDDKSINWRVFYAMRHASPFLEDVMPQLEEFDPQNIILMPLYPQYSTTTTESFFDKWNELEKKYNNGSKVFKILDYHDNKNYIKACSELILKSFQKDKLDTSKVRFLFSAHGLPESIIQKGDPYQKQIETGFSLIKSELEKALGEEIDARLCYQSRVGPKKWLKPTTESEIIKACNDQKGIVLFPTAFTSEHSETLFELDIELREIADKHSVLSYTRVPALQTDEKYINCLAKLASDLVFSEINNTTN